MGTLRITNLLLLAVTTHQFRKPWSCDLQRRHISHEEADCIIVQQEMMASEYQQEVSVIADDTDVFILLIHYYLEQQLTNLMVMESPIHGRYGIDICRTVKN